MTPKLKKQIEEAASTNGVEFGSKEDVYQIGFIEGAEYLYDHGYRFNEQDLISLVKFVSDCDLEGCKGCAEDVGKFLKEREK